MALAYSEPMAIGTEAPAFSLKGVDDQTHSLESFGDAKGLMVVFMCNHCPYVIAVQDRINALAKEFAPLGIPLVGINPNDSVRYPDDNFEAMKLRSKEEGFVFPYLVDETQEVARAYHAVCTPDPYLFENRGGKFELRYHGRIDDNWKEESAVTKRDLADAARAILEGGEIPTDQKPAMGCSIKWK